MQNVDEAHEMAMSPTNPSGLGGEGAMVWGDDQDDPLYMTTLPLPSSPSAPTAAQNWAVGHDTAVRP
jgi:hypothetical protein